MQGYIAIHRQIVDSSFYKDSQAVHLWLHLIMKANHKDKCFMMNGSEITVKRGQLITGRKALSLETGIQESKIQRLLKAFEKCHMIEQQTNNRNRLITVLSYDSFQAGEQQMNNKRTTDEQQVNTNNNVNNDKNVNKTTKYSPDDLKAAEWIYSKLLIVNPEHKKPNMDSWANTIRLMRERDNRTHEDICKVFAWANSDSFWSANILSPSKLREKFDQLLIKVNQPAVIQQAKPRFADGDGQLPNQPQDNDFIEHEQGYITYER